jgi:hypothetical protein
VLTSGFVQSSVAANVAPDNVEDSGGGVAIAIRRAATRHACIHPVIAQQLTRCSRDLSAFGPYDFRYAELYRFRPFGHRAQHEHWFAQSRRFFLDATRVGQYQPRRLHGSHQLRIRKRIAEHDLRVVGKHFLDDDPHVGVGMNRIENPQTREFTA